MTAEHVHVFQRRYIIVRSRLCVVPHNAPSCNIDGRTVYHRIHIRTVVPRRRRIVSVATALVYTCTTGRNRSDTRTAVGLLKSYTKYTDVLLTDSCSVNVGLCCSYFCCWCRCTNNGNTTRMRHIVGKAIDK